MRECARRFLAGEPVRSICTDLNERGVRPSAGGGAGRRRRCAGCSARRGSAASASTTARSSPRRCGPRSSAEDDGAADPRDARRPGAAHEQERTPLPARRSAQSAATAASAWSRGRARTGSAAMPARRGRASPAAARPTSTPSEVEQFVTEAVLAPARLAASCSDAERRQRKATARGGALAAGSRQAQAQLVELAAAYGNREITMAELRAARKPIEQRLTDARKQLGKVTRTSVLDGYVGNGDGAAGRVGLARPQPAARDRRRRRRSRRRRPGPPRLQPLRRVALARRLAALSQQLRDLRVQRERVRQLSTGTPWSRQVRSTHARARASDRQFHCAQQAGGPRHPSTDDDSHTCSGAEPM